MRVNDGFCSFLMKVFSLSLLHAVIISCGTMGVGLVLAYPSPTLTSITEEFSLKSFESTLFNAICSFCGVLGAPLVQLLINKTGRRLMTFISSMIILIGWVLLILTPKSAKWLLFIARAISGIGIGATSTISPIYISEISPTELRGAYGVMSQLSVSIGAALIYLMGIWLKWKTIAYISLAPTIVLVFFVFFIPDSTVKSVDNASPQESLFQAKFVKPLVFSILVVFFQQFSGFNGLLSNLNTIFSNVGLVLNASVSSLIVGSAQVISTAFAAFIVDKFGRKPLWYVSSIGQSVCLLVIFINEIVFISNFIPIVFLFLYVLLFGIGVGPLPWFISPELFPDTVRSKAVSIVQALNWVLCSGVMFLIPVMISGLRMSWTFFTFGMVMFVSFLYGLFVLPETAGVEMGLDFDSLATE